MLSPFFYETNGFDTSRNVPVEKVNLVIGPIQRVEDYTKNISCNIFRPQVTGREAFVDVSPGKKTQFQSQKSKPRKTHVRAKSARYSSSMNALADLKRMLKEENTKKNEMRAEVAELTSSFQKLQQVLRIRNSVSPREGRT